jgi:hypothetical protein
MWAVAKTSERDLRATQVFCGVENITARTFNPRIVFTASLPLRLRFWLRVIRETKRKN